MQQIYYYIKAVVIEREMNYYFMQLHEAEKKCVVAMIKTFLQSRGKANTSPDVAEYNDDMDKGVAEVERGEHYTHDAVVTMLKKLAMRNRKTTWPKPPAKSI